MASRSWTPMRWPCGPLDLERGKRREGLSADDAEVFGARRIVSLDPVTRLDPLGLKSYPLRVSINPLTRIKGWF